MTVRRRTDRWESSEYRASTTASLRITRSVPIAPLSSAPSEAIVSGFMRFVRTSVLIGCLGLVSGAAQAEIDFATAENLLRDSGMLNQIGAASPGLQADVGGALAGGRQRRSDSEVARVERAAREAFAADRLQGIAVRQVAGRFDPVHLPALQRWLASPTGREIARIEGRAAADRDLQWTLDEGRRLYRQAAPERRRQYDALIKAGRSVEGLTELTNSIALSTYRAVVLACGSCQSEQGEAEFLARLKTEQPRLRKSFEGIARASTARHYAGLGAEQLKAYVAMLRSPAGQHFNKLSVDAFIRSLTDGLEAFGRALPESRDQANT